jgi:hypothetical protein
VDVIPDWRVQEVVPVRGVGKTQWEIEADQEREKRVKALARYDVSKLAKTGESKRAAEYLVRTRDSETKQTRVILVVILENGEERDRYLREETRQKFLCVNGPLTGKRVFEREGNDYVTYNRATQYRRDRKEAEAPTAVLVWRGDF